MKTASTEREAIVAEVAARLNAMDKDWLFIMPVVAGRCYPMAFIREDLTKMRRRYWLFGDHIVVLNRLGRQVRSYIKDQDHGRA